MSIITGSKQDDLGEDSGASVFGGLVKVNGKIIKVYICIVETSTDINRMEVELSWEDGKELTDEEYLITVDEIPYDDTIVRHCIRTILAPR